MRRTGWLSIFSCVAAFAPLGACQAPSRPIDERARQQMLSLLLPSRIEIVEPFTRVCSFDEDSIPDGIELLLRAVNALDNPGLMIVGTVRIELYEYVPASGLSRGRRYAQWVVELNTEAQQRTYWNRLTQMYEFRLAVDTSQIPPADRYVLVVTYESPFEDRLTDELVVGRSDRGPEAARPSGRSSMDAQSARPAWSRSAARLWQRAGPQGRFGLSREKG